MVRTTTLCSVLIFAGTILGACLITVAINKNTAIMNKNTEALIEAVNENTKELSALGSRGVKVYRY